MQKHLWKIIMQIQTRLSIKKVSLYAFQALPHPTAYKKPNHWSTEKAEDQFWRAQTMHDDTNGRIKLHELRASSARARPKTEIVLQLTHGWAKGLLFLYECIHCGTQKCITWTCARNVINEKQMLKCTK